MSELVLYGIIVLVFAIAWYFSNEKVHDYRVENNRLAEKMSGLQDRLVQAGLDIEKARGDLETRRLMYISVEKELREQVQDMAEKLSHLSRDGLSPVVNKFEKKPEPKLPYSQALYGFLDAIEFAGARELVEEDIERLRATGMQDDQILTIISDNK